MKTTLRSPAVLLLLAALPALLIGAALPEAPAVGKFLVLRNGHTLEGDIERVGEEYRVRRQGGETLIPARTALRLFHDKAAAYQFLQSRAKLDDPDERLRLANWCLDVELRAEALAEATEADRLRPKHRETQRLLARLQAAAAPTTAVAAPTPKSVETEKPVSAAELTPEAAGHFAQKVQPILMNACAACHANGRGGAFQLSKITDTPTLNRRATQENLAAVLGQVNFVQPQASPLLMKALTIHGGAEQAPLTGRQVVAYRAVEDWLRQTLATNPQLGARLGLVSVPSPPAPPPPIVKTSFTVEKRDEPRAIEAPRANVVPITPVQLKPVPVVPVTTPVVQPRDNGDDAFDPAEFNRRAFPQGNPVTSPKS